MWLNTKLTNIFYLLIKCTNKWLPFLFWNLFLILVGCKRLDKIDKTDWSLAKYGKFHLIVSLYPASFPIIYPCRFFFFFFWNCGVLPISRLFDYWWWYHSLSTYAPITIIWLFVTFINFINDKNWTFFYA